MRTGRTTIAIHRGQTPKVRTKADTKFSAVGRGAALQTSAALRIAGSTASGKTPDTVVFGWWLSPVRAWTEVV